MVFMIKFSGYLTEMTVKILVFSILNNLINLSDFTFYFKMYCPFFENANGNKKRPALIIGPA